jgi:hypothetical protein
VHRRHHDAVAQLDASDNGENSNTSLMADPGQILVNRGIPMARGRD